MTDYIEVADHYEWDGRISRLEGMLERMFVSDPGFGVTGYCSLEEESG